MDYITEQPSLSFDSIARQFFSIREEINCSIFSTFSSSKSLFGSHNLITRSNPHEARTGAKG